MTLPSYDHRFYGIYEGICMNNADPEKKNKIVVQVPQVLGDDHSAWARPCLPVTSNSNHPDHKYHLATEVAALLKAHADHSYSGTTGSGGDGHTHPFSFSVSHNNNHAGNTNYLEHQHVSTVSTSNLWNDKDEITTPLPEHTPHRLVPHIGQKVWVMFIGGDPNFPVWMGVEL